MDPDSKSHYCALSEGRLHVIAKVVVVVNQGCPQYWPEEGMLRYGPVQVECMSCSMDCDVISRLFRICNLTRVSAPLVLLFLVAAIEVDGLIVMML